MCDQRNHPRANQTCSLAAGFQIPGTFLQEITFKCICSFPQTSSGEGEGCLLPSRPLLWLQKASSFEQDCTCFPVINGEMDFLTPSDSEVSAPPSASEHTPSSFSQASYTYSSSRFPFVISLKKEKKRKPSPITSPQLTRVTQTFPFHEQLSHVGKQSAQ